ncbi:MAG: NADH:ubiquinone oxidoreductase [Pseudomonadota bacterium]
MSIKTPPEAIKREALMFGVMAGVIATTAMTLIGGINFLIAALVGVVLALVVWYIVVALGKESPPPRGEGNPDVSPQTSAPVAPAPKRDMPEPVVVSPKLQAAPLAAGSATAETATPEPNAAESNTSDPDPSVGEQPQMLSAARDTGADDLKRIKGVGPKLEKLLHTMGIYHFDQIADWTPAHVAWMDENLQGFKGRVSRDDWVGQARGLV